MDRANDQFIVSVTVRGGSQGVKNKALVEVNGKPLIQWTIEQALQSPFVSRVYVSTDAVYIMDYVRKNACVSVIERPDFLCTSDAGKYESFKFNHAELMHREPEYNGRYVDFDATSPLRTKSIVDSFLVAAQKIAANECMFTVTESQKIPNFNILKVRDDDSLEIYDQRSAAIVARQHSNQRVVDHVASMYCFGEDYLHEYDYLLQGRARPHFIPKLNSLDIDVPDDIYLVESMQRQLGIAKR